MTRSSGYTRRLHESTEHRELFTFYFADSAQCTAYPLLLFKYQAHKLTFSGSLGEVSRLPDLHESSPLPSKDFPYQGNHPVQEASCRSGRLNPITATTILGEPKLMIGYFLFLCDYGTLKGITSALDLFTPRLIWAKKTMLLLSRHT